MKFSELAPRERHNFVYFLLFWPFVRLVSTMQKSPQPGAR